MTTLKFWLGGKLIDSDEYRARERAAAAQIEALALKQTWIAGQIGASQPNVSMVLNAKDPIPKRTSTLLLRIERLVSQVKAGEVIPYEPEAEAA
jgi:transcriptional regulator